MKILFGVIFSFTFLLSKTQQKIDLLVYNGTVYTIDKNFSRQQAVAIKNGKIMATGTRKDLQKYLAN